MPHGAVPEPATPPHDKSGLPSFVRGICLVVAWLPFWALVTFFLTQFDPIFTRLEEKGELPWLPFLLRGICRLNAATFGLLTLVFYVLLIVSDLAMWRAMLHLKRGRVWYWAWFAGVIGLALFGCLLVPLAVLLPTFVHPFPAFGSVVLAGVCFSIGAVWFRARRITCGGSMMAYGPSWLKVGGVANGQDQIPPGGQAVGEGQGADLR